MLNREKFISLLDKYTLESLSPAERSEFFTCVSSGIYDDLLLEHIEKNMDSKKSDEANLPPHRSADILHKILSSEKQNSLLVAKKPVRIKLLRWAAAAAIIIGITFSFFIFRNTETKEASNNFTVAKNINEKINASSEPLQITMEDGSIITLQPGSSIHYPEHFLNDKREIYLEGDAFFQVTKNPARPFFVYNKDVVTRVLGTSFNIKMNKETGQVEVAVKTGRVEVYENKPVEKMVAVKKDNGVILLPNQKVIYDQETRHFISSLVDDPLPLVVESTNKKPIAESFVFEETPLKTVLKSFEITYGIDIVVENENLYNCLFTGDVSRQDIYTRLNIICQSVQASYEVEGTKILIMGPGCN
ncbi:MAG TPA: FecR family protein [Ginsengibacter sp.]